MSQDAIIDRIYEAAAITDNWQNVLHELSKLGGARGAVLLLTNPSTAQWVASPGIQALIEDWYNDGWYLSNTRGARLAAANTTGFVRDIDIYDNRQQIDEDPQIKGFLRPRGFGWAAATFIPVPSGDNVIVSLERDFSLGPVDDAAMPKLEGVRPHLARAALLSARLGMQKAKGIAAAFKALGLPAGTLNRAGRLTAANDLFQALIPTVFVDRRERLTLANVGSDKLLANTLTCIGKGLRHAGIMSIPMPATEQNPAMVVHAVPVKGAARDVFSMAATILIATPVDRIASPSAELLQGLFDLTPAEAKVAQAVAKAKSIEEIAVHQGVGVETVRSQLKKVFAKTGTARQAHLTRLLAGLTLPSGGELER